MQIFKCDIIIIDEISMLTAGALEGVNKSCSFVKSMGTAVQTRHSFGGCSVIAVGDLYQLPAVQSAYREAQVYSALVWSEFKLIELTENCRSIGDQVLANIQHKIRDAPEEMTEDEWAVLESRVCANHCDPNDLVTFVDHQEIKKSNRSIETNTQDVHHCPFADGTMCLAARRKKVDAIICDWVRDMERRQPDLTFIWVKARDTMENGTVVTHPTYIDAIDRACRGLRHEVPLFVGMDVVLTMNKNQKKGFINGRRGVVENLVRDVDSGDVICIHVRDSAGRLHTVRREASEFVRTNAGPCKRSMFPVLPAICVTVHRVQGATHEHDLHVLLNEGK